MSTRNRVEFVRDFFFTDIMNHVQFLKWTSTLDKDDDVLLVGILERLASPDLLVPIVPFYGSITEHKSLPKNALHVAKAYAQIQALSGHDYNIFEFAYLDPESYRLRAFMAAFIQITFFSCLVVYNIFEQRVMITPSEDGFSLVVLIMFISSALFFVEIRNQFRNSKDFVEVMKRLGNNEKGLVFLWLNSGINQILGILVFFFNIYFILVSDSPTAAVLNSVALAFIIEIDDAFRPNWNEESKESSLAMLLHAYIVEPFQVEEITVTKKGVGRFEEALHSYLKVGDLQDDSSFTVILFTDNKKDSKANVTVSYETTEYVVTGPKAEELHDALCQFHCLEELDDILLS